MPGYIHVPQGAAVASAGGSRLYVYMVSIVAAISGLLFGFDIAVINGAIIFLRQQFALSEVQIGRAHV